MVEDFDSRLNVVERELRYIDKKLNKIDDLLDVLLRDVTRLENRLVDQDKEIEQLKQATKKGGRR